MFGKKKPHSHTWDNDQAYEECWKKMFIHKEMNPIVNQKCKTCNHSRNIRLGIQFNMMEKEK